MNGKVNSLSYNFKSKKMNLFLDFFLIVCYNDLAVTANLNAFIESRLMNLLERCYEDYPLRFTALGCPND